VLHHFIYELAEVVAPLALAHDVIEQSGGGWGTILAYEGHEGGNLYLLVAECEMKFLDISFVLRLFFRNFATIYNQQHKKSA
jgi:hypothetical protein